MFCLDMGHSRENAYAVVLFRINWTSESLKEKISHGQALFTSKKERKTEIQCGVGDVENVLPRS